MRERSLEGCAPGGSDSLRILVMSPWGMYGGYSGPIILLNRLFSAIADEHRGEIDIAYRDRGIEQRPGWVNNAYPIVSSSPDSFTMSEKIQWVIAVRSLVRRRSQGLDVIHLHGAYLLNILPLLGLRSRAKVVVLPVLDGGDLTTAKGALARFVKSLLFRHVLKHAMAGFSLASGISSDLERLGLPASRIHDMPNLVDVEHFKPSVREEKHDNAPFVIGFVGKMGDTKGAHIILDALDRLLKEGRNVRGLFVGPFADAQYEARFRALEQKHGLKDSIDVVGFQDDASPFFQRMDAFVLPSKAEGMPGSMVEAMSSGLPVIVTDAGSMKSVVESSAAGFVIDRTSDSIVEAVSSLLDSPKLLAAKADAAREYACANFSNNFVASTYVTAVKHELLKEHKQ